MVDGVYGAVRDGARREDDAVSLDADEALHDVVTASGQLLLRTLPVAARASVVVGRRRRAVHHTDAVAARLHDLAEDVGSGPCPDVLTTGTPVLAPDLGAHADRWPVFTAAATGLGVHGVLCVPVLASGAPHGVVAVFCDEPGALTPQAMEPVGLVATHLTAAATATVQARQLEVALRSRDVIGQAKGILMERHGIDADRAFEVLVRYSRSANTKLREVARSVVQTRSLPSPDAGPARGGGSWS